MCFLGQIRDDGSNVPGAFETEKRCSAFEVDQDQIEIIRRMRRDEPEYQGPEKLGFPGTCCADAQAMRAHASARRLVEVQHDGFAAAIRFDGKPDRYPESHSGRSPGHVGIESGQRRVARGGARSHHRGRGEGTQRERQVDATEHRERPVAEGAQRNEIVTSLVGWTQW